VSITSENGETWTKFIHMMKERRKENCASSKKLLTSIKEKGPLGKKSPFTRKEESNLAGGSPALFRRIQP